MSSTIPSSSSAAVSAMPAARPAEPGTSPARASRRSAWTTAAIFAGVAAIVFGGIAAINRSHHPLVYDEGAQAAMAGTLAAGRPVAIKDPNIDWRALRAQHIAQMKETPEVILFGGSRWQEATAAVAPGKRYYNAFVTNDFFEDIVALTALLDRTHHLPKTLILSVRFFTFDYLDRHDPLWWTWTSPEYRATSARLGIPAHSWTNSVAFGQTSRLLSADAAWTSLTDKDADVPAWQPTDRLSDAALHVVGPDGALRFSEQHLQSLAPAAVEQDALETARQHRAGRIRIDRSLLGQLGTLVRFLRQQGVQVVLVQTPFHPAYLRAIQGSPYYDDIRAIEADTRRIAAESGAQVGGGFDSVALGCAATDYRDFNHASDRCLQRVLKTVPGLK